MRLRSELVGIYEQLSPPSAVRRRVSRKLGPTSPADLQTLMTYVAGRDWTGRSAIDVGANSGLFSYPLSSAFAEVMAIEPILERARFLERALPANVQVVCTACSDRPGIAELNIPIRNDGAVLHSLASLQKHNVDEFSHGEFQKVRRVLAPITTLDILGGYLKAPPGLVKIDVEGHEISVLRGAGDLLKAHKPVLFVELERRHGVEPMEVFDYLAGFGYRCNAVRRGELQPAPTQAAFDAALAAPQIINYLFVPAEA